MKKNLISILILALLVVNVVLTAVMMFSVIGATKKTSALVTNIATVLNLELDSEAGDTEGEGVVSLLDTITVDIPEQTILLKAGPDGKSHYCLVNVSLLVNSKHEDYETLGASVDSNVSVIKGIINEKIGNHTYDECQSNPEMLRNEILSEIQAQYNSDFIYKVTFSSIMYQ